MKFLTIGVRRPEFRGVPTILLGPLNNHLHILVLISGRYKTITLVPLRKRYWVALKTRPISRIPTTKSALTLATVNSGRRHRRCCNYILDWEKFGYEIEELGHFYASTMI